MPHPWGTESEQIPIPTPRLGLPLIGALIPRKLKNSIDIKMPRLDLQSRKRVILLNLRGYSVSAIKKRLEEESIYVSVQALYNLLRKYRRYSTYVDLPRRKMDRKITPEMLIEIDTELHCNDELTARQLQRLLTEKHPALEVSIPTIKRARRLIGWVCTRPHYCQLIREVRFDVHGDMIVTICMHVVK